MPAIPLRSNYVKYLLVLLHVFSSGSKKARKIFNTFPEYTNLVQQNDKTLQEFGLTSEQIRRLRMPPLAEIELEMEWAEQNNQWIVTFFDSEYPDLLREIHRPPMLLFVRGNKQNLSAAQLAIVGSRNPTPQGSENAYMLAKDLVAAGFKITSGMALGVDAAAHRGALSAPEPGSTIAVMGAGLNHIYPWRHKKLAQDIVASGGTLVSEFPLDVAPLAENFPQRNRIISGISLGTIVVEATLRSGSLITAYLAADQGRDVFALPGSIHNSLARGCHELIRQGAKLVETAQDILVELPIVKTKDHHAKIVNNSSDNCVTNLSVDYRKILQAIDYTPTSIDVIAARSSLTISEIMSMLLHLELHGHVQRVTGGYVLKANMNVE